MLWHFCTIQNQNLFLQRGKLFNSKWNTRFLGANFSFKGWNPSNFNEGLMVHWLKWSFLLSKVEVVQEMGFLVTDKEMKSIFNIGCIQQITYRNTCIDVCTSSNKNQYAAKYYIIRIMHSLCLWTMQRLCEVGYEWGISR